MAAKWEARSRTVLSYELWSMRRYLSSPSASLRFRTSIGSERYSSIVASTMVSGDGAGPESVVGETPAVLERLVVAILRSGLRMNSRVRATNSRVPPALNVRVRSANNPRHEPVAALDKRLKAGFSGCQARA